MFEMSEKNGVSSTLAATLRRLLSQPIPKERKVHLNEIVEYAKSKRLNDEPIQVVFICTHNSRRSQLAEVWAQTAANLFGVEARCFSGGVEVTAFNSNAIQALAKAGFLTEYQSTENPEIQIRQSEEAAPILCTSKLFDDASIPKSGFAAIMTCAEADENCPFIPGAEIRIPLRYEDPKISDGTESAGAVYQERSEQIGTEMLYVFSKISASK
jgi:arsenate reductase (thioredoxin)